MSNGTTNAQINIETLSVKGDGKVNSITLDPNSTVADLMGEVLSGELGSVTITIQRGGEFIDVDNEATAKATSLQNGDVVSEAPSDPGGGC